VILAVQLTKLIFHSQPTFFGLSEKYNEGVYEEIFYLKHYGGWSFIEAYNLPMGLRRWWLKRIEKQFKRESEEMKKSQSK
jgi:hypothetical protein